MPLQTLKPTASQETILATLARDGACIIADLADAATVRRMADEVMPFIARTPFGVDDFTGHHTQRTGALVARTPTCRKLVLDPTILGAAREFLKPWSHLIILHLAQTIYIHPGQGSQVLHRDRLAWGTVLPLSIEPQFNTMWALDDFTAANGATRVVPGSHNITFCLAWLRQEENMYLSCPPHIARHLEPELQELLGYTQGNYALGYYSDPESTESGRDILPPEFALGRKPREGFGFSLADATDSGATFESMRDKVPLGEDV
jgi:ectoine hydroxylase-related dioxygenase (phytanoyl-CoA dioxygenase family)